MPASADAEAKSSMKENGTEERSCIQAEEKEEFCTVKNVLPGQHLSLMITKVRKGKGEGRVLQVLAPSPDEIQAPCPHFGNCGGCTYLALPYEKQLGLKEKQMCIRDRHNMVSFQQITSTPLLFLILGLAWNGSCADKSSE